MQNPVNLSFVPRPSSPVELLLRVDLSSPEGCKVVLECILAEEVLSYPAVTKICSSMAGLGDVIALFARWNELAWSGGRYRLVRRLASHILVYQHFNTGGIVLRHLL